MLGGLSPPRRLAREVPRCAPPDRPRRAPWPHYIRDDVKFRRDPDYYIYGRYDLGGAVRQLDEAQLRLLYPGVSSGRGG